MSGRKRFGSNDKRFRMGQKIGEILNGMYEAQKRLCCPGNGHYFQLKVSEFRNVLILDYGK